MSLPIEIPVRSKSIPRTTKREKRNKEHASSDSQVTYFCFTSNEDDTDPDRRGGYERVRSVKRRKSVKLSRSKRVSQSFGSTLKVEKKCPRRCSTPECGHMINNSDGMSGICPTNSITAALLLAHQTLKLSCPLLPIEITPPVPAPLVVEDPPSSDNVSDLEEDTVKYNIDPVLLNGSSGNFGSTGARSAPSTPQGVLGPSVALSGEPHSQPCSPSYTVTTIPKSPSHVFGKYDKGALKQLSSSAPIMTAQARSPEPPSPKVGKGEKMPAGSSKARQKKFHRLFTQVDDDERVINYYSCALIGDILLQGHLYITKNYFAFYSNVFGYVTKLLIPLASVMKISKEKTARIIPNAVGVATADDKHVFGSLLSRDSTYKLMTMVLKAANSVVPVETLPVPQDIIRPGELDASEFSGDEESSSQSGNESPTIRSVQRIIPTITKMSPEKTVTDGAIKIPLNNRSDSSSPSLKDGSIKGLPTLAKYNVFLLVSTLLLLLLFTSAGILLYRISRIQTKYTLGLQDSLIAPTNEIYNEILHWQSQLHSKSAGAVHSFLDTNLDQIAKVRKSLEALSTLLMPNSPSASQAQAPEHRSEVPPETNTKLRMDSSALPDGTAS
ncbi:GRAM domain containing 1B [Carabus blaptoides fortunei]